MTRWIIWPSVSSVLSSSPVRPLKEGSASCGNFDALAQLEGVVVGDDDLGALRTSSSMSLGTSSRSGVVAVGIVGLENAEPILDGQAGRADQEAAREHACSPGRRTALIVCHAMSMAMTVVLPAPVASFSARRISSGFASRLALARWSSNPLPAFTLGSDLGEPDGRLDRLDLAEERADAR